MARFLIVGGGVRAPTLVDALEREGHVPGAVEDAGRLGELLAALEHVAIVCWLSGASPERFLLGAVDSSIRGFVYEPGGWEPIALETAARNSIPMVAIGADPADLSAWLTDAQRAIEYLLSGRYAERDP